MKTYQVDQNGYYGEFGGAYIPEILHQCVENLRENYLKVMESDSFKQEFRTAVARLRGTSLSTLLRKTTQ